MNMPVQLTVPLMVHLKVHLNLRLKLRVHFRLQLVALKDAHVGALASAKKYKKRLNKRIT